MVRKREEIVTLWRQLGTFTRVADHLNRFGEKSRQHKPYTRQGVRASIEYWIVRNPDKARAFFPHLAEDAWRKKLMVLAGRIYFFQRKSYARWMLENPWSLEPKYDSLRAFYFSQEEMNAIKEYANCDPDVWREVCPVQSLRIRNPRTRPEISD